MFVCTNAMVSLPFWLPSYLKEKITQATQSELIIFVIVISLAFSVGVLAVYYTKDNLILMSYGYDLEGYTDEEREKNVAEEYREVTRNIYWHGGRGDVFNFLIWLLIYVPYSVILSFVMTERIYKKQKITEKKQ